MFVITMGMVLVAVFAANGVTPRKPRSDQPLDEPDPPQAHAGDQAFVLSKPVLDGEILSLNPAKLAQLLPERLQEDRATRSSAWIQVTYAEDFPWLLRVDRCPAQRVSATTNQQSPPIFDFGSFDKTQDRF